VIAAFRHRARTLGIGLGLASWLVGCGNPPADAPTSTESSATIVVMKVAQLLPDSHPTTEAMRGFKTRAEELAGGRLEVRLFPNGQVGNAVEVIELCRMGNVEAGVVATAALSDYVPELIVTTLPFVFQSTAHQYASMDGEPGQLMREAMAERGLMAGAFFDAGTRNIMTRPRPVTTPDDLKGLKIRVMPSAALQSAIAQLGASAQPMSMGEVYSALQTQVIDGWENNPATCLAYSMYETGCIHFSWTRHVAIPDVLMISQRWLAALEPEVRNAVVQAAAETQTAQRQLWQEREQTALEELKSKGMKFNEVEAAAFAERVKDFYQPYIEQHGARFAEILRQIQSLRSKEVSG
jgi:tripartite ATP-independent transporter DctP family solute receptor